MNAKKVDDQTAAEAGEVGTVEGYLSLALAAVAAALLLTSQGNAATTASLREAIDAAVESNLTSRLAKADSDAARAQALEAAGALLPHVLGTASQSRIFRENLAAQGLTGGPIPSMIGPFSSMDARLRLTQTLFDTSLIKRYQAAGAAKELAARQEEAAREQVAAAAALAYIEALRAKKSVAAAQADVELAGKLEAILADAFPPSQFGMAMAIYGMAVVVAPILGPTMGGWITDNFSWRWIFFINIPVGIVSLMLTSRLIQDPPSFRRLDVSKGFNLDYIGLGLVALGLASLQIVLDKGQELDWFGSPWIVVLSVVTAAALISAVIWELYYAKEPVVDLRLLGERNFAVAILFMAILGAVFNGSFVLLPQFLQGMMGYSATAAGMVLSPTGVVLLLMMPVAGMLVTRIQPRWLIAFGFAAIAYSMWLTKSLTLGIDQRYVILTRLVFGLGGPFMFIPINVAAYAFVPKGKNNSASGLINLARNMGASIGIAGLGAVLERRTQFHQAMLVARMTPYDGAYNAAMSSAHQLAGEGARPLAMMYGLVQQQAQLLSYVDGFQIMVIASLAAIPLVLLIKRVDAGKAAVAVH